MFFPEGFLKKQSLSGEEDKGAGGLAGLQLKGRDIDAGLPGGSSPPHLSLTRTHFLSLFLCLMFLYKM